ncbi:MAG: CDP-diacylglycerol diphosphatase, partial [Acetobacteraceae bacterium]
ASLPQTGAMRNVSFRIALGLGILLAGAAFSPVSVNPNALWEIVHGKCVVHEELLRSPLPCIIVDRAGGYAILKDIDGATQFLLIPTARVTGIEDPAILAPAAPNYWQAAWDARNNVEALAGHPLPRDDLSLAINSTFARTQNQLHIHIDCIAPTVRAELREYGPQVGTTWEPFPVPLSGHAYRAMRVETLNRPGAEPFELLADGIPGARQSMGSEALVIVGTVSPSGDNGFYLLETRADEATGNHGFGEELQDHSCAVGRD